MYQYTQVQFIKRKEYYDVIIYYSRNGEKFRPTTGVKVLAKHLTKSGAISSAHPSLDEDSRKITQVQDRVENLVAAYKEKYGEKPPVVWLEKEFGKPQVEAKKDLQDLLCYWPEFIKDKTETVRSEKTIGRINNVKHTLEKFREMKNYSISFAHLDQIFFNDFVHYMIKEHKHARNKKQDELDSAVIPTIGLNNDVAIKRLKDFADYLKYCVVEKDVDIKLEKIKRYMKVSKHKFGVRTLGKSQKWELTLAPEEIQFVVNLDHFEPEFWNSLSANQKRYLDIMVFMCLQGTAPVDTQDIGKPDIRNGKIIKDRSKSGQEFKVELDPIAEQILERYNYDLRFTEQTLNDELKRLFVTIFELYRKHYEAKNDVPYEMICRQKVKKGSEDVIKIAHRALFVENMTGRRSFITNLLEEASELGIKETMDKAGHVRIGTTLGYVYERQQNKKAKRNSLFGISKLKSAV
jgi:hypothetical protein